MYTTQQGLFISIISCFLLALSSCTLFQKDKPVPVRHRVSLMTFNVENLFDTKKDAGKDDFTFLPAQLKNRPEHIAECKKIEVEKWRDQCLNWDWNEETLVTKLERLRDVVLQVNERKGPDILILQEVENLDILNSFRNGYLKEAGYKEAILIEGTDKRGIDVAFLTKLEVVGTPILHKIVFSDISPKQSEDVRGILEATFKLPDGQLITGYAVHFPAPFHPTKLRIDAYEFLNKLKKQLPGDRLAFAAGDFNTTSEEVRGQKILDKYVRAHWDVAHEMACPDCKGTTYYPPKDDWSFLDMILLSESLTSESGAWTVDKSSIRIANAVEEQKNKDGTPASFEMPGATGVSDHWPLYLELIAR